jgi:hypothetical protein
MTTPFYKRISSDGYIAGVGTGCYYPVFGDVPIDDIEHNDIMAVIHAKPKPPAGYEYYLKPDMTWELLELPPVPETPMEEPTE